MTDSRLLVVALHDVAPPFETHIRELLDRLTQIGVSRCALKVVPNWHGKYPLVDCPSLVHFLRQEAERGSEIVLHGFTHESSGPIHGSAIDRLRATVFAPHTAEFLALTPDEAEARVSQGIETLTAVGLPRSLTFCAPGWLITPENKSVIARAGIRYLTNMHSIEDLQSGLRMRCLSFGQMGSVRMQEAGVACMNAIVLRSGLAGAYAAKVYIHPQFEPESRAVRRVLASIDRLVREDGWQPTTFEELPRAG